MAWTHPSAVVAHPRRLVAVGGLLAGLALASFVPMLAGDSPRPSTTHQPAVNGATALANQKLGPNHFSKKNVTTTRWGDVKVRQGA
jgi:hypothetical protein